MKRVMAHSLAALFLTSCGCLESWKYKFYPPNPFEDIEVVAILPFINQTHNAVIDGEEFGNILASELAKFDGFRPVRPQMLRLAMAPGEKGPSTVEEALNLARRVKADAVLACAVTDYDPYMPPKVAVSVQFLRVASRRMDVSDVDALTRSASWRRGPFVMSRERAGHFMASFETVYDAHEERIRWELSQYVQAQEAGDTPFTGDREFLFVQSRFMQFVSNQVIHRIFVDCAHAGR
jgi:hypothetical protein